MDEAEQEALFLQSQKGGRNQRKRALEKLVRGSQPASSSSVLPSGSKRHDSGLGKFLVQSWSWGEKSAAEVQRLTSKAREDEQALLRRCGLDVSLGSSMLKALAGLGSNGKFVGNINKELQRHLGEPDVPIATTFEIPMRVLKPRLPNRFGRMAVAVAPFSISRQKAPFLLPHVWFHHLFHNNRREFHRTIIAEDESPRPFWVEVAKRRDPRIQHHPLLRRAGFMDNALPVSIHGDGVAVLGIGGHQAKSLDCISWQSLLATEGGPRELKHYIFGLFDDSKAKQSVDGVDSMDEAWRIISWSFRALFEGKFPSTDHRGRRYTARSDPDDFARAGTLLAEGRCGVIWGIKGDLEYMWKDMYLKHYRRDDFCECCLSSIGTGVPPGMHSYNFAEDAAWRSTLHSNASWRATKTPDSLHRLFREFDFLSSCNLEVDELHTLHLGVVGYTLGSVLWLLVYRILPRGPHENCQYVWSSMCEEYRRLGSDGQLPKLDNNCFTNAKKPREHFPRLKGKAAQLKHAIEVILKVWSKECDLADAMHREVRDLLVHLTDIVKMVDAHSKDVFMSVEHARSLRGSVTSFLQLYTDLGEREDEGLDLLWNIAPKFHWLEHFADRAFFLSPRRGACWLDESFVGVMKVAAKSCSFGTPLHRVPLALMAKYRWGRFCENM